MDKSGAEGLASSTVSGAAFAVMFCIVPQKATAETVETIPVTKARLDQVLAGVEVGSVQAGVGVGEQSRGSFLTVLSPASK